MSGIDLYEEHFELIQSVLALSCRHHRLPAEQAEEFRSWAQVRLLDNDRAILRKFGHRGTWRAYLSTVVERLYLDWRNHEWGKWRPSAEARRLGDLAIELERLVNRDRQPYEEAVQVLIARGLASSAAACEAAWLQLPRIPRRLRVDIDDEEALANRAGTALPDDPIEAAERRARAGGLVRALERAMSELEPPDQAILRMRYWNGIKVSEIARLVQQDQKQLYRRFERLTVWLAGRLEAAGFGADAPRVFDDPGPNEGDAARG